MHGKLKLEMPLSISLSATFQRCLIFVLMSGFVVSTVSADAPRDVHFSDFSTTDDSNESALPCQQLEPIPDAVVDLGFVPIQQLRVDVRPKTENEDGRSLMAVPNAADDYFSGSSNGFRTVEQVRPWGVLEYRWEAPALCHDPLYFEEINAERYGNSFGDYLQPFVSAGHFYGTIGLLPLKMVAEHPHHCYYVLGHYRPGLCVPFYLHNTSMSRFDK